jgi:hypothetical protein
MKTEELVASLTRGLQPVARHAVGLRLATGLAGGALAALFLLSLTIGFRPDLWLAIQGPTFWIKWSYTASLAVAAVYAAARLARPEPTSVGALWLMAIPVLGLTMIGLIDLANSPRSQWLPMWLGKTWMDCPWLVLALAMPIFAGLLWSFRRLAPTRLRAAGAVSGFAAGAFAATIYCLHCPEASAIFVLTWYSLGILLAASIGALAGPRLMRW